MELTEIYTLQPCDANYKSETGLENYFILYCLFADYGKEKWILATFQ